MRSQLLAAVPALMLSLIPACSATDTDELGGAADETGDGKADSPGGASTYYSLELDVENATYNLRRLNAETTTCHDRSRKAACVAADLDWSESGLSDAAQVELLEAAYVAEREGVFAIVRGRFVPSGELVVTEGWVAEGEGASTGVFAKVVANGRECVTFPCANLTEMALNSTRSAEIVDLDYELGGLSEESAEILRGDMATQGGILVAGDRYTFTTNGHEAKGRTATNAYRNLATKYAGDAGECFVGGCSGQICSDEPGVITTCEWRPAYACYREATCERQPTGTCGWTQTTDLQACLADN